MPCPRGGNPVISPSVHRGLALLTVAGSLVACGTGVATPVPAAPTAPSAGIVTPPPGFPAGTYAKDISAEDFAAAGVTHPAVGNNTGRLTLTLGSDAMGTTEFLRHKVEVLQRHCDDAGRDIAEIEFTGGCKPIIRSTREAAQRLWESQMAHNRTPMADVADDDTFWVGTPEDIAEKMAA